MTLVEILVVVVIISVLIGVFIVGGAEWDRRSKIEATRTTLAALDAAMDEHHVIIQAYPVPSVLMPVDTPVQSTSEILSQIQGVGDIAKAIGGLRNETWVNAGAEEIWDAWRNPLFYYNPDPNRAGDGGHDRPIFWSGGPDGANNSTLSNGVLTVGGDDVALSKSPT
jgi:type II secretory pathway pseudopilin PulG